jgi:prevent-host-death family protein
MQTVNIHEAKTHLSRLIAKAVAGEPFVIAKAGVPLVEVKALESSAAPKKRQFGQLRGQISVPDDFDTMFQKEIEDMFGELTNTGEDGPA